MSQIVFLVLCALSNLIGLMTSHLWMRRMGSGGETPVPHKGTGYLNPKAVYDWNRLPWNLLLSVSPEFEQTCQFKPRTQEREMCPWRLICMTRFLSLSVHFVYIGVCCRLLLNGLRRSDLVWRQFTCGNSYPYLSTKTFSTSKPPISRNKTIIE